MTTPKLQLPELSAGQAGKELTHNAALARLDQAVNSTVLDKDLATPPGSPADGAGYIVAAAPTGAWTGKANNIAFWRTSSAAWDFIAPFNGLSTWVEDESKRYEYKAGAWAEFSAGGSSPAVVSFTADRTLGLTDVSTHLRGNLGTQLTATIAPQASVSWADNTELRIEQAGVGSVVIAPGAGVTINKPPATYARTKFPFGVVTLKRVASDVWTIFGDIAPIVTSCDFRGKTNKYTASTTTLVIDKPSGVVDGDILVAVLHIRATATITSPGWTEVSSVAGTTKEYAVFTKTAASEGANWTFTSTGSGNFAGVVAAIKGGVAVDVSGTLAATNNTNPAAAPSVTTTAAGLIVACYFNGASTLGITTPPAGMTLIDHYDAASFMTIAVYYEIVPAGATGTRSVNWVSASGVTQMLVAIR